ncbi:hypothetical protein MAR_003354 [Mya arenaria]|uniref:Uncharacterized protein n=1 Tax=Mya arenaria TaxID=6604 RepID=A0ABY7GF17_MYAAR|nr:uncharacterized protein LOC128222597 [Mya arenaria]WAR29786.1 hypothetical protein MAR_003354 [Mya arenaria]
MSCEVSVLSANQLHPLIIAFYLENKEVIDAFLLSSLDAAQTLVQQFMPIFTQFFSILLETGSNLLGNFNIVLGITKVPLQVIFGFAQANPVTFTVALLALPVIWMCRHRIRSYLMR